MKPKASTIQKIAVRRIFSYNRHLIWSQLGCLVLTLALLALPLAGVTIQRAPILIPLAADLVPLGTSLQSPPVSVIHPTSFMAPARLVLGPLPSAVFEPDADSKGRFRNNTSPVFPASGAIDSQNGRSPPSN
jgi:hypothetical protein